MMFIQKFYNLKNLAATGTEDCDGTAYNQALVPRPLSLYLSFPIAGC